MPSGMRMDKLALGLVLPILCAAIFLSESIDAQVTGATLTGTVMDQQGAAIAGAKVVIKNTATGTLREVTTNRDGLYLAANLLPGRYQVTFSAVGFDTAVRSGIQLTVGANEVVNLQLGVGKISQQVEVTDSGSGIEMASSSISHVVDGTTTRELPLNGRDWTQLATLEPGIAQIRTQPDASGLNNRGNRGFGTQLTISGGRPQQNNYRLDGISINDYANSSPGSTLGVSLGADAIQEFSVVSSNYAASYGMTSGGVVNAVTRSGTNLWHGSAYEFLRNDALDAKGFFDAAKLPFRRNQFGATIGGPIRKDKTFLFGDYEGLRQSLSTTASANVPSPAARAGQLTSGAVMVDLKVAPYLNFWPQPNGNITGDVGTYTFASKSVTPEDFFTIRADHNLTQNDSFHVTYLFDNASTRLPDNLNVLLNSNKTRRQTASFEESHIFSPALMNIVRVGANRVSAATLGTEPGANPMGADPQFGVAPGLYAPVIGFAGTGGVTQFQGGLNGTSFGNYGFTTWQLYDDAFWTKGIHSLKFGFAFMRIDSNLLLTASPNGVFRFNTLRDFLVNNPASFQAQLGGATPRGLRQSIYGAYIEDDIRLKPNLTVNLGLRYEPSSVPSEVNGKLANLRALNSSVFFTGDPYFHNPTLRNFEPRVGFAWDPFKKGKTSIRGGFGMFDVLPMTYQFNLMSAFSAPFFELASATSPTLTPGSFPTLALSEVQAASLLRVAFAEFNPKRNYVMQWNFNIQQELLPGLSLMVGYVGNHGMHQAIRSTDANAVQPTVTPNGLIWPCMVALVNGFCSRPGGVVVNPAFGQIDGQVWSGSSLYDAMIVQVKKQMRHGFQLQGSFTWGKSTDTSSSVTAGGPFQNSISGQLLNFPLRGPSDFDIRRNLVINGIWNVPTTRALPGVATAILDGWELSGIFQASGGSPFTPLVGGNPLGLGSTTTFALPDRVSGPGCDHPVHPGNVSNYINLACFAFPNPSTRLGTAGRNSLIGPGLVNMDFALMRNFPLHFISEAAKLQFRAEFFNLANHPNFAAPLANNQLFTFVSTNPTASHTPGSLAGKITITSTPGRQTQFGLKFIF